MNGGYHHSRSPLRIILSLFEPDRDFRLQIAGSLSRGLQQYFGAISLPRGLPPFEARSLRLLQGGGDCLKLVLCAVCCNKFLTFWDLVSSVFKVSFWAEVFEPWTIYIVMGTMFPLSKPETDNISNLIYACMWRNRFGFFQSSSRQSLSWK